MNPILEFVAPALGLDVEAVAELMNDTSKHDEIKTKLASIRILTPEKEDELFKNRLSTASAASIMPLLPEDVKNNMYRVNQGSIMEAYEKELLRSNGVTDWQRGKDYKDAQDLTAKLVQRAKGSTGEPDKRLLQLQSEVDLFPDKLEAERAAIKTEWQSKLANRELNAAFTIAAKDWGEAEVVDYKKAAIQATFTGKGYQLAEREDGSFVVQDKEGNVVKDKDHRPLAPYAVLNDIHQTLFGKLVPNTGRGANSSGGTNGNAAFSQFASEDEFVAHLIGEGIRAGTPQFHSKMQAYKAAVK